MLLNYEKRNSDFLAAVRSTARRELQAGRPLESRRLVRQALASPAPAYYVSADYVMRRLNRMRSGRATCRNPQRLAMLDEIREKFDRLRAEHPDADRLTLLDDMLGHDGPGASRFFIGEEYALRLYTGSARRAADRPRHSHRRRPHSRPGSGNSNHIIKPR